MVLVGSALLLLAIWLLPALQVNFLSALLILVCGFFFVTVSARITGEIGSSSNPISGMVVATLLITCLVYLLLGWTSAEDRFMALSTAAIVGHRGLERRHHRAGSQDRATSSAAPRGASSSRSSWA